MEQEVKDLIGATAGVVRSNPAEMLQIIKDIIQIFKNNPEIIAFILSWLTKKEPKNG